MANQVRVRRAGRVGAERDRRETVDSPYREDWGWRNEVDVRRTVAPRL